MKKISTKIGIVVPVYKVKIKFLEKCINSLREQTYKNIEIVLVDDCSPDNCGDVCEQFARMDARIKVIHHTANKGLPGARNTGIDNLSKDCSWVTFVDSDDWLDKDTCEIFLTYLNRWEKLPDMVIFSGCKNYPASEMVSAPAFTNETWFEGREQITILQETSLKFTQRQFPVNSINLDSACWRFISLDYLNKKKIRFINIPYREDGLFFLYTTEYAEKIVYIYETFYHYRSTENSMVNMYRKNADYEHGIYLQTVWEFIKKFNKNQDFIDSVYYTILLSMEICITQKFFNTANVETFAEKHKNCKRYFQSKPYSDVFKKIELNKLRKNHLIKALLIKNHIYYGVVLLGKIYNKIHGKENYE